MLMSSNAITETSAVVALEESKRQITDGVVT